MGEKLLLSTHYNNHRLLCDCDYVCIVFFFATLSSIRHSFVIVEYSRERILVSSQTIRYFFFLFHSVFECNLFIFISEKCSSVPQQQCDINSNCRHNKMIQPKSHLRPVNKDFVTRNTIISLERRYFSLLMARENFDFHSIRIQINGGDLKVAFRL